MNHAGTWIGPTLDPRSYPGVMVAMPDGSTVVSCPLVRCLWQHIEPLSSTWVLDPGEAVDAAINCEVAARHARIEAALRDHLSGHTADQWVAELVEARRERADLIRKTLGTVSMALRQSGVPADVIDRVMRWLLYGQPDDPGSRGPLQLDTP